MKTIDTKWEVWTYDVWGNEKDGWDVNDRAFGREYPLALPVRTANPSTPQSFGFAFPSDKQIKEALGVKPRVRIEVDGDDTAIYVRHWSTGYPLGEMTCVSHESLSPIKEVV